MPIYKTAYDTTAGSGYNLKTLQHTLKQGSITGSFQHKEIKLDKRDVSFMISTVVGGNVYSDSVPYFSHPYVLETEDNSSLRNEYTKQMYIDLRSFGKWHAAQNEFKVTNKPEYSLLLIRAVINSIWLKSRPEILRDISIIPLASYMNLIGDSLARRYSLDPGEQLTISVVAGFFYNSLFTDADEFSELEINRIAGNISKASRIPADKVFEIIDNLKPIKDMAEFCQVCITKTQSIRLQDFNVGMLTAMVTSAWFGSQAKETVAVSMEHPPTWITLIYASLHEATFKRTILAKIVERHTRQGAGDSYINSINSLLGGEASIAEMLRI